MIIDSSRPIEFTLGSSVYIDGTIFFLMRDRMGHNVIVLFFVKTEEFRMLPFNDDVLNDGHEMKLISFGGCLTVYTEHIQMQINMLKTFSPRQMNKLQTLKQINKLQTFLPDL